MEVNGKYIAQDNEYINIYNEDKYLKELQDYILDTYKQHYSKSKFNQHNLF